MAALSLAEFRASVASGRMPGDLSPALTALWHDARGDWESAHVAVQDDDSRDGAWVHGYLHRKEGDFGNARYWYARARRSLVADEASLTDEWTDIAQTLAGK